MRADSDVSLNHAACSGLLEATAPGIYGGDSHGEPQVEGHPARRIVGPRGNCHREERVSPLSPRELARSITDVATNRRTFAYDTMGHTCWQRTVEVLKGLFSISVPDSTSFAGR